MSLYPREATIHLIDDVYGRLQETKLYFRDNVELTVLNLYIPHENHSNNSIYRLLTSNMISAGDLRHPMEALFDDFSHKIRDLQKNLLVVGGDVNAHAYKQQLETLLQETDIVDVSVECNKAHIPTYKRSNYQLDKIFISPPLRELGCQFYISPFDPFFLSDHCALVLDIPFLIPVPPVTRPKSRILSSSNTKWVTKFIKMVAEAVDESGIKGTLEDLKVKEKFTEDDIHALFRLDNIFTVMLKESERKLSKRQYNSDGYTPKLERLRRKRRFFRKLLKYKKSTLTKRYLLSLWDGAE